MSLRRKRTRISIVSSRTTRYRWNQKALLKSLITISTVLRKIRLSGRILYAAISVLLRTGHSSEDLYSETLASVVEHIRLLESEIVARDEQLQAQFDAPLQHERDLVVQDLKNHKSIFAPIRRLPNDVLLYIFQMSIDDRVKLDVKTIPWLLGYICHHWRAISRTSRTLWTNISLESVCSSNLPSGCRSLRNNLLSLSGGLPLSISVYVFHPSKANMFHRPICPGDDRDILWEDIALHLHRLAHIFLMISGSMSPLQTFSCHLPLLHRLCLVIRDITRTHVTHICRLFPSTPLLQDLAFCGSIDIWRELSRVLPFSQLVKLTVTATIHKLDDANPDFYACVKEATMLEDLHFNIARRDGIVRLPTPSDVPLFLAFVHNNIRRLTLEGEIPSILDRCPMPNLKEMLVYSEYRPHVVGPEIEHAELRTLLRFVGCSECNVRTFSHFRPILLSTFKGVWKQWSSSLEGLTITVNAATRTEAVRELTFEEGEPDILPNLQRLMLRTLEGSCIFQDDSLLRMASSRCTRHPGCLMKFTVMTRMLDREVISQDVVTQMKRLREMRAVGVRVELLLANYLDYFETDERFDQFVEARKA